MRLNHACSIALLTSGASLARAAPPSPPVTLNAADSSAVRKDVFRHIELTWGNDLRIDPLTRRLALVAVPWREVLTDSAGHVMNQAGFFTGIAEQHNGRWQFRDAHWSAPVSQK